MSTWTLGIAWTVGSLIGGVEIPGEREIMGLTPEAQILTSGRQLRTRSVTNRLEQLSDRLLGSGQLFREYDNSVTRTVSETIASGKGNCLSFTLTFVALARQAGMHAVVQDVGDALVWDREGDVIYETRHVNAGVRVAGRWNTADFEPELIGSRDRHVSQISDERALAYFHNNRAVETMNDGRLLDAFFHARRSLQLAEDHAGGWNTLGLVHRRAGDYESAEYAYLQGLEHDPEHSSTLTNLAALYERTGQEAERAALAERLEEVQRYDPFHHFMEGIEAERRGDLDEARTYLQRAIRMHSDEHQFHYAAFRVYYAMERDRRAARALERAIELAEGPPREEYAAKREQLRR